MENLKINKPIVKIGYSANKKYSGKIKIQENKPLEQLNWKELINLEDEVRNLLHKIDTQRRYNAEKKEIDSIKLTTEKSKEIIGYLKDGRKLMAIKRIKEMRGIGLNYAKTYIDKMINTINK